MNAGSTSEARPAAPETARAPRRKNPALAAALAFFLGPFGMLYVGRFWLALALDVPVSLLAFGFRDAILAPITIRLNFGCALAIWAYKRAAGPEPSKVPALFRRELTGYFVTPVAYVFIAFFLLLCGGLTFYLAGFYARGQAVLGPSFFDQHPILYVVLIPAISMRLWAEERKQGTIELLMTLPVTLGQLVVSKFLAAWVFTGVALALTFPLWITVNYLGDPDNGVIAASYLGSWLMAGTYLALGAAVSALTKNQVIAFVISMILSFLMVLWGVPQVYEAVHSVARLAAVADFLRSLSMMSRFSSIARGVIELGDLLYFASLAAMFLFVNAIVIELRKAA